MNETQACAFFHERGQSAAACALLAVTAFCITLPMFVYKSLPDSYDILVHFFQADQFSRAMQDGLCYPRWVLDSNNGYGSPNFVFYAPLSYAFVALLRHFFPPLLSFITAIWFSFFLSGLAMLLAATQMFGKRAGLVAAFFYQIMPFHLLDLYERGGSAELFGFVWFPLVLYFLHYLKRGGGRRAFLGLSLTYAGLIFTHLVSAFMFTFVMGLSVIYALLTADRKVCATYAILALLLGLGLSSVFLVPAALEQKFVQIDYITKCVVGNYRNNFLSVLDIPRLDGLQFWMRIYTIMEILFFLVIILVISAGKRGMKDAKERNLYVFLFPVALFLTTPLSEFIWATVPGLPMLQFPWRWLSMAEVSLAFLVGAVFSARGPFTTWQDLKKRMVAYALLLFVIGSIDIVASSTRIPSSYYGSVISLKEYTPIWVKDRQKILSELKHQKVSLLTGNAALNINLWKSEDRTILANALTPSLIRVATFYFPGWEARIDGSPVPIKVEDITGAMLLDIPAGRHELTLRFADTPVRHYAAIVSLVSLFALAIVAFPFTFKHSMK